MTGVAGSKKGRGLQAARGPGIMLRLYAVTETLTIAAGRVPGEDISRQTVQLALNQRSLPPHAFSRGLASYLRDALLILKVFQVMLKALSLLKQVSRYTK